MDVFTAVLKKTVRIETRVADLNSFTGSAELHRIFTLGGMTHWTVYTREGCSLCEAMLVELASVLGRDAPVEVIDIAGNASLEAKYGQRIPVLLADGEFVCAYRLDRQRLDAWLG